MDNIYLSLVHTGSWKYLFHEIPSTRTERKMDIFYICGLLLDLVDMIPEAGVPKGLTLVLDGHTNIQESHIQQKSTLIL